MNTLNTVGRQLATALAASWQYHHHLMDADSSISKVHVVGAGRTVASAYEQLRNAAEYTEEHLLLQRAIRRFYKRLFLSNNRQYIASSGDELVVELTLAGYLQNDSVSTDKIKTLGDLALEYYLAYTELRDNSKYLHRTDQWVIDVLSVEAESTLSDHNVRGVFLQFAFDNFLSTLDRNEIFAGNAPLDYELSLFTAAHRSLLKSDNATIRWALLRRFRQTPEMLDTYIQTNQKVDELLVSKDSEKLLRIVNRRGATMRVLWRMINERDDMAELLQNPTRFLNAFEAQIHDEYNQIGRKIRKGIIKSVIFLIITKFLIGIAIEVPYDYYEYSRIMWLPLIVNLFAPPVYMILLSFTLTLPKEANTRALVDRVETLLYRDESTVISAKNINKKQNVAFNVVYSLFFIMIFGFASWGLISIGFNIVHLLIFFTFFSAASFLGFRLSRIIRELEAVDSEQNGLSLVRDFLYMPFVVVGRWMSDKYARINIVAMVLDMIIELPLKTVLRLIRQWSAFISAKKDDL